jgi:hypothetical protein
MNVQLRKINVTLMLTTLILLEVTPADARVGTQGMDTLVVVRTHNYCYFI